MSGLTVRQSGRGLEGRKKGQKEVWVTGWIVAEIKGWSCALRWRCRGSGEG